MAKPRGAFLKPFVANDAKRSRKGLNKPREERGEFIAETHEKDNFTQCTRLGYCVEHKVTPREKFRVVCL
jgi:hypothetical protein